MKRIKVPVVDESPGKCGPSSLRSVLAYYGVDKTEDELARACGWTEEDGVSPGSMSSTAKSLGFASRVESGATLNDLEEWAEEGTPVIVCWDPHDEGVEAGSHYSVVVRVGDEDVELMDPEPAKYVTVERGRFDELWIGGSVVVIERTSPLKRWAASKLSKARRR